MRNSFQSFTRKNSPLAMTQKLGGKATKKHASNMDVALPLTSLIDAFSILVIFLLMGTQGNGIETPVNSSLKLPIAANVSPITKEMAILRIQKGAYYLNEKPVAARSLTEKLMELKKNAKENAVDLMIQADQSLQFADLDPLIKAGSLAGIQNLKFAVMPEQ